MCQVMLSLPGVIVGEFKTEDEEEVAMWQAERERAKGGWRVKNERGTDEVAAFLVPI